MMEQYITRCVPKKFAMGEAILGGLSAAGGQWGSGGDAPSCQRLGFWEQSPHPPEVRGSGGGAPSARKFCIFLQKQLNFRVIVIKNIAFKTWHRNWQHNVIQLVALMAYVGDG